MNAGRRPGNMARRHLAERTFRTLRSPLGKLGAAVDPENAPSYRNTIGCPFWFDASRIPGHLRTKAGTRFIPFVVTLDRAEAGCCPEGFAGYSAKCRCV